MTNSTATHQHMQPRRDGYTVQLSPVTKPFWRAQNADRHIRLPAILGRTIQPGSRLRVDLGHPAYRHLRAGATCYAAGTDGRYWAVRTVQTQGA